MQIYKHIQFTAKTAHTLTKNVRRLEFRIPKKPQTQRIEFLKWTVQTGRNVLLKKQIDAFGQNLTLPRQNICSILIGFEDTPSRYMRSSGCGYIPQGC
jgi:hypothetical protein